MRQTAAYYGFEEPLDAKAIRVAARRGTAVTAPATPSVTPSVTPAAAPGDAKGSAKDGTKGGVKNGAKHRKDPRGGAKPFFEPLTRQVISTTAFAGACVVIVLIGRLALGGAWAGVILLAPFVWIEAAGGRLWLVSASEAYLALFSALAVYILAASRMKGDRHSWRRAALAALCAAAAAAASPGGIFVAAAVAAFFVMEASPARGAARAFFAILVALAVYPVAEPALWYMGSRANLDLAEAMRAGTLLHWTARFAGTTDFLMPLRECFPYWGMLPLAAAALYAARQERWALPVTLYTVWVVGGAVLALGASQVREEPTMGVAVALVLAGGLSGMYLLQKHISVKVAFRE